MVCRYTVVSVIWVLVTGKSVIGIFGIFLCRYFCFCVRRSSIEPECIGLQPQDRLCRVFSIMLSHIENNDLSLSAARTLSRRTLVHIDCGGVQLPHRLYAAALFRGCRLQRSRPVWIIVVPGRHLDKREKNVTGWGRVEQVTFYQTEIWYLTSTKWENN